jgi:hypothetical protein
MRVPVFHTQLDWLADSDRLQPDERLFVTRLYSYNDRDELREADRARLEKLEERVAE